MKKWLAIIICWFMAFFSGLIILPEGFNALINWLGPLFGTSFRIILSTIYLLFADPLTYTTLAILWAVTGLIGGLIIRKRIGSVLTMLTIYSGQFVALGIAGLRIYEIVDTLGIMAAPENILNVLPLPPKGASLGTILNAPVIKDIYQMLQGVSLETIQSISPSFIIDILLNTIVLNAVKNIAILVVAALIGCEIGKQITKLFRPSIESFRMRFAPAPVQITKRLLIFALLISLATSPLLMSLPIATAAPYYYYYSEFLPVTLTETGTAVFVANFFDTEYILQNIDATDPAFANCLSAVVVTQQLDLASLSPDLSLLTPQLPAEAQGIVDQALNMYQILPTSLLVVLYKDIDFSEAQSRAQQVASLFSTAMGTSFTLLFSQPVPTDGPSLSIALYSSTASFTDMADNIMGSLPVAQRDGIATLISDAYDRGIFTPGETSISANGTSIAIGLMDAQTLIEMSGGGEEIEAIKPFLPSISGHVPFINLVSYFAGWFHSSPIIEHTLSIAKLLDTEMPIKFSPDTNASTVLTVIPMGNVTVPGEKAVPIINIATTVPTEVVNRVVNMVVSAITGEAIPVDVEPPSDLVSFVAKTFMPGAEIDPSAIEAIFTYRFPLKLRVVKSVSVDELDRRNYVDVTVTVYNDDDTDEAEDVVIDDSNSLKRYSQSAIPVSGSLTGSWDRIENRSSRSFSYRIQLIKEGIYTFPSAIATYTYKETSYTVFSNFVYVQVKGPGVIQIVSEGIPFTWALLVRMIDQVPGLQGNGSIVLTVAVVVIVCLAIIVEYRGFRKWVRKEPRQG